MEYYGNNREGGVRGHFYHVFNTVSMTTSLTGFSWDLCVSTSAFSPCIISFLKGLKCSRPTSLSPTLMNTYSPCVCCLIYCCYPVLVLPVLPLRVYKCLSSPLPCTLSRIWPQWYQTSIHLVTILLQIQQRYLVYSSSPLNLVSLGRS